jgi:PAS domain S-box-containing protein
MEHGEIDRVRDALKTYPKGITIAELAKQLNLNRISTSKYLNMLFASGQAEMRIFGPSKVFYPSQRIPLSAILNFSTSHLLVMDDNLTIIDANDALLRFFSLEKEELVGQRIDFSPIAGFFDPTIVPQIKRSLESHDSTLETRITLQGKDHVLKIKCIPTVFESGDHGVSLLSEDITELTQYRQHLEELVDERAKELQKTNDRLKKEINSHKKSRIELENSEKKYRELVENANSIILKMDSEGNIIFFNEFARHFFGYTENEVLGKSIYDTIVPSTDASGNDLRKSLEDVRHNPDKYERNENENVKKNGERVWISWTNKLIRNDEGIVTGMLSIGNDITESKRVKVLLKVSEERFRLAMDASSDSIWDWDITTDRSYFSPAYYRILGYEPEDLTATGQGWAALIHPDDRKRTLSINQDCIENRCQNFEVDYRLKARDGSWKWVLARGKAVSRNAEGRALRMIGTHVHITERKRMENALRTSQVLLEGAMDLAHLANWEYDYQTGMFTFDDRFYTLYGTTAGREGGYQMPADVYLQELIPPEDRHLVNEELERCRNISDPHYVSQFEHRIIRRDGGIRHVIVRSDRTLDNDGHVIKLHGVSQDITERKLAEDSLRTSQILLTEAMDLAHLANWEYDDQTGIFTFDDRFYALYDTTAEREGGYQMPADVYYKEFVHPDDRCLINEENERCRKISDPNFISQMEHRIIRRDGKIRYLVVRGERIMDNDGHIIKIHGVNQDITKRKIAEEDLRSSKQKLSAIVNFLPDATFVIDASGTVIAWNRAIENLTGRKAGDIVGRGNFEHTFVLHGTRGPMLIDFAVHPGQEIPEKYHFIKREQNKFVAWTHTTHLQSNGTDLWGFAVPLYDSEGKIIGAIETIRDVTGIEMSKSVPATYNP